MINNYALKSTKSFRMINLIGSAPAESKAMYNNNYLHIAPLNDFKLLILKGDAKSTYSHEVP